MTKDIKHFHSKVVGVTHKNPDGTKRQDIIKGLRVGEGLLFARETDNPKDPLAMAVLTQDRQQIGYLQAELAHEVASKFEHGRQFTGLVSNLTGGTEDKPSRGVNIDLIEFDPALGPEDIQQYVEEHFTEILGDPDAELIRVEAGEVPPPPRKNGTLLWVGVALVIVVLLIVFFA